MDLVEYTRAFFQCSLGFPVTFRLEAVLEVIEHTKEKRLFVGSGQKP